VFHVHWERGFWNADRGFEYPLQLGIAALALGLVGRGVISIDGRLANPAMLGLQGLHGVAPLDLLPPMTGRVALLLAGAVAGSVALAVPHLAAARHPAATERS